MPSNDLVLLNNLLVDWQDTAPEGLDEERLFDVFCSEQVLKDQDLSPEEIEAGRVGGGNDGGIDGWYCLLNGELLDEDSDLDSVRRNPDLSLFIIQAKRTEAFQESVFDKVMTSIRDLLDLDKGESELLQLYSADVVERVMVFRNALMTLTPRHPQLHVHFALATKGSTNDIHPKVRIKAETLKTLFGEMLPNCSPEVTFIGARQLLETARRQATYTLNLRFIESAISVGESYIVLVNLSDYFEFVSDDGALRKYIFESNVRDFQGNVEVNNDIRRTLEERSGTEFWWLNNGVTIVASQASITGKVIALDDVQIVNGLQTSVRIFEYLSANPDNRDGRALLCRVIVTNDPQTRDKVIKATNFQTAVSAASLRATDPIQRNIEEFLLPHRWYYDRRKNYYRNLGRPASRIIGVPYLAQAVMAMGLSEPDNSRARPTTLIKRQDDYRRVFNDDIALEIYLWCAATMREIDSFLVSEGAPGSDSERREFRFHLATLLVTSTVGSPPRDPKELISLKGKIFSRQILASKMRSLLKVLRSYDDYGARPLDRIAKSKDFVQYMLARSSSGTTRRP